MTDYSLLLLTAHNQKLNRCTTRLNIRPTSIYLNDLYNVSEFLFSILYADDTCVLLNGKHLDDLIIRLNRELELLFTCTWLQANELSLNGQKTYYILFHRARIKVTNQSSTLVMGDSILNATN